MHCLKSLSNNFRFTSSCFSVSPIFFFFSLSFLDVFFFFPLLLLFVRFRLLFFPIQSLFYYSVKQTSLSAPSGYDTGLSVNLSAILPITFSTDFPIFRSVQFEVILFGMLFPFFQMVRRTECTGKLLRNYAIEYDRQNFLKFVSKLLDASI